MLLLNRMHTHANSTAKPVLTIVKLGPDLVRVTIVLKVPPRLRTALCVDPTVHPLAACTCSVPGRQARANRLNLNL